MNWKYSAYHDFTNNTKLKRINWTERNNWVFYLNSTHESAMEWHKSASEHYDSCFGYAVENSVARADQLCTHCGIFCWSDKTIV